MFTRAEPFWLASGELTRLLHPEQLLEALPAPAPAPAAVLTTEPSGPELIPRSILVGGRPARRRVEGVLGG